MWNSHPSSEETTVQHPSSESLPLRRRSSKLGPPEYIKPRPYPVLLERLENDSNSRLISEYEQDIYSHLMDLEQKSEINPKMIDLQPEIEWYMRPYLLDFLIEMHTSFKLKPHTLFLCMNIIDKYCSKRIVFKQHYQLIGCTAMWMAAKYEDKKSRVPTLRELSMMCRNVYDESMFKEMEMHMLSTLEWSLGHVSLEDCLQISIKTARRETPLSTPTGTTPRRSSIESATIAVARYLCELSLFQRSFLLYPTSLVAITAHLMASAIIDDDTAANHLSQLLEEHNMGTHCRINSVPKSSNMSSLQFDGIYEQDEDDEEMFDEDVENTRPDLKLPFLSGFDGEKSFIQIRQLSFLFINAINNPSEILVTKYTQLGVINAVNGFLNKHYKFLQTAITTLNLKELKVEEMSALSFSSHLYQLSDLLLGLRTSLSIHMLPPSMSYLPIHTVQSSPPPLTPSSQNSSSSIFSSGAKTPNMNNFTIRSTGSKSEFTTTPVMVKQQQQRRKIVYPNSSPVADLSSPQQDAGDYENHQFKKPMHTEQVYYNGFHDDPVSSPLSHHQQNQSSQSQNMIY